MKVEVAPALAGLVREEDDEEDVAGNADAEDPLDLSFDFGGVSIMAGMVAGFGKAYSVSASKHLLISLITLAISTTALISEVLSKHAIM